MVALKDDLGEQSMSPEKWILEGKVHGKVKDVSKATRTMPSEEVSETHRVVFLV